MVLASRAPRSATRIYNTNLRGKASLCDTLIAMLINRRIMCGTGDTALDVGERVELSVPRARYTLDIAWQFTLDSLIFSHDDGGRGGGESMESIMCINLHRNTLLMS